MTTTLMEQLSGLDAASLADADKTIRVLDAGIRPLQSGLRLLGVARTVRCYEDFLAIITALDESAPGEVLVVDTCGSRRAVVGELFSLEAERRGLAGIIVDGAVRDVQTLRQISMPVYARSFCPCSGTVREPGTTQCEVNCGGVVIRPGDIIIGDDDGVVVASAGELEQLAPAAAAIQGSEAELRRRMAAGDSLLSMLNYAEHVAAIRRGEPSKLAFRL